MVGLQPARVLLVCCMLLAGSVVSAVDTSTRSCSKIYRLPTASEQCGYVKDHCIDSLNDAYSTNLLALYFCNPPAIKVLVVAGAVLMLVVLFKGIGLTAERYFSVILSQISQDLNIPPRLAGCTLLALGNGAPDLSSSIEAIRHGQFDLALGALMGSLMFVGCVVAGRIISLSGRTGMKELRCKAAQVRDVLFLAIAVTIVGIMAFAARKITVGGVCGLISVYASYVMLVLVADLTKSKYGVEWTGLIGLVSGFQSGEFRGDEGFSERLRQALLPRPTGGTDGREHGLDSPTDTLSLNTGYSSEVELTESPSRDLSPARGASPAQRTTSAPGQWSEARPIIAPLDASGAAPMLIVSPFETIEEFDENIETGHLSPSTRLARAVTALPGGIDVNDVIDGRGHRGGHHLGPTQAGGTHQRLQGRIAPKYSTMTTTEYRARAFAAMSDVRSFRAAPLPLEESLSILNLEDMIEAMVDREEYPPVVAGRAGDVDLQQGRRAYTTTVYPASEDDMHGSVASSVRRMLQLLSRATQALVMPLALLLKATIPLAANSDRLGDDGPSNPSDPTWFVGSAVLSPFFLVAYFSGDVMSITLPGACTAAVTGAILGVAAWEATKHPQVLDRAWVAATIGMYGFVVSALWIGLIAEEIVGIIHVFGVVGRIKPAVLGVTVLAWGNSLTDLMANIAIAMTAEGGVSMAMTACFAGPLFNILLGLGVGFAVYFKATGLTEQSLNLDLIPAIGALFALVNCLALIFTAAWHRGRLPAIVGWVMIGWYCVYMCFVAVAAAIMES